MYGLNRLNNLRTLFTATASASASASASAQLSHRSPPARSIPFLHASSTAGIGYFVGVGEGRRINDDCFKRKLLPPELSRNVVTLTCGSSARGGICDVYVVGTTHGTTESCQQVRAVIEFLKPQCVCEFRTAYEEAMEYGGKVILGDRLMHISLRRTLAKMSLWHTTKYYLRLCVHACYSKIMKITKRKETDYVNVIGVLHAGMSKNIPTFMETFVHERDQYMSASLLKVTRKHNSVVAVVGKGHLPGIRKNWKQPIEQFLLEQRLNVFLRLPSFLELPSFI